MTYVVLDIRGLAHLACFNHCYETGGLLPLTKERPENWPNLTIVELNALIERAKQERNIEEEEK
jgi:hypothetical protein